MQHAQLRKVMWVLALVFPLLNLVGAALTGALSLYAAIGLNSPQDILEMISAVVNAFLLPAAPFAFIALLAGKRNLFAQPTFGRYALAFSAGGAFVAISGTWILLWLAVWLIGDQGGAIGYWGVICSMPIYVPLLMIIGWGIGAKYDEREMA